jgi:hypothetical protein
MIQGASLRLGGRASCAFSGPPSRIIPVRRKAGARERNRQRDLDELAQRLEGTGRANGAVAD